MDDLIAHREAGQSVQMSCVCVWTTTKVWLRRVVYWPTSTCILYWKRRRGTVCGRIKWHGHERRVPLPLARPGTKSYLYLVSSARVLGRYSTSVTISIATSRSWLGCRHANHEIRLDGIQMQQSVTSVQFAHVCKELRDSHTGTSCQLLKGARYGK